MSTRFGCGSTCSRSLIVRASLAMAMFGLMWLPTLVRAELTLPAVFSDHMVLQRDKPVKIWG
ncbi:MAG: hypothetical protein KDA55_23350, partial [Planctomycetales bacterium]|nr:hypothetical protein [Planctomycetales bacterium]